MTCTYRAPASLRPLILGALGGVPAAAVALVALSATSALLHLGALAPTNGVGAWLVRWLQSADPSALRGAYADAALAGIATVLVLGALAGAVFGALLGGRPEDQPLAWGFVFGVAAFAAARWVVAPALDPAFAYAMPSLVIGSAGGWLGRLHSLIQVAPTLLACLIYGLLLGVWVQSLRALTAPAPRDPALEA